MTLHEISFSTPAINGGNLSYYPKNYFTQDILRTYAHGGDCDAKAIESVNLLRHKNKLYRKWTGTWNELTGSDWGEESDKIGKHNWSHVLSGLLFLSEERNSWRLRVSGAEFGWVLPIFFWRQESKWMFRKTHRSTRCSFSKNWTLRNLESPCVQSQYRDFKFKEHIPFSKIGFGRRFMEEAQVCPSQCLSGFCRLRERLVLSESSKARGWV